MEVTTLEDTVTGHARSPIRARLVRWTAGGLPPASAIRIIVQTTRMTGGRLPVRSIIHRTAETPPRDMMRTWRTGRTGGATMAAA